jgi:hypothetical protein
MTTAITLEVLPARLGDCLLLQCYRDDGRPWRVLVDGGPSDCWPRLRDRLLQLPPGGRQLDLVVVTHVDHDHIGGALRLLEGFQQDLPGLTIGDVWFNGLPQLPDPDTGAARSVAEGESLLALLSGREDTNVAPWNRAFDGAAAMTADAGAFVELAIPAGPTLTLLSPTPKRLAILRRRWLTELDRLQRGEASDEAEPPDPLAPLTNLERLAAASTTNDAKAANGSSIALLLEHRGASCLLAADAFPNVLGAALTGLAHARGMPSIPVDAFKLPHHASRANVTNTLMALAPATHYVVSTNGDRFNHPDDEALARVVTGGDPNLTLWFNYRNPRTERWSDPTITQRYGFHAIYPPPNTDGVRLDLPARGNAGWPASTQPGDEGVGP